ncbi:deoxyguanosinetriphosphate triphosphohydrolase [Alteromonas halophila]|uniref:Uncharacterized protein n=1 Tax=Alteromonas halophila TaxID=516698 RepID=A0A918MZG3_9ALTE|nr:deoxyguanosinetriphosphate triphosphohydrolase [Alteromonas halophila]GGW89017.1 hypothetical protein GCM10007391_23990 [Alteromonas halophila]
MHIINNNIVQLPLPFEGFPSDNEGRDKGWSYLLSDSLAFKKDMAYGIRMQKPDRETVPVWIKKLITAGQCKTIYVENLSLAPSESEMIRQLCSQHAVALVNVNNDGCTPTNNVLAGPW